MIIKSHVVLSHDAGDVYRVEMGVRHAYVGLLLGDMISSGDMRSVAVGDDGLLALHRLPRIGRAKATLIMVSCRDAKDARERIAFGLSRAQSGDVIAVFCGTDDALAEARRQLRIDESRIWIGLSGDEGEWIDR